MRKSAKANISKVEKRHAVFESAADAFARYGFRRTAMNDIAEAAGLSRPALYLMFENKEDLFRELVAYRQGQAIEGAKGELAAGHPWPGGFVKAVLAYERILYEPIAQSPHGEELIDINVSIASDLMVEGRKDFVATLTKALEEGEKEGALSFAASPLKPKALVELLVTALGGVKKDASTVQGFRRQIKQLTEVFLRTVMT